MAKITKELTGAPLPAPVALLTTIDAAGRSNIITLAWVGVVCSDPLMLSASIRPPRYSHELLRETPEAVVNVPTADILYKVDQCGMISGREEDKFTAFGLSAEPADLVKPPLIVECPINIETRVHSETRLGTHDLFILEVLRTHVDEALLSDGRFEPTESPFFSYLGTRYFAHGRLLGYYGYSKRESL